MGMIMKKLIITVALTGNVPTKKMNPNVPMTPDEIAADVRKCAEAGASLFHIHARDDDQKPTLDTEVFKKIVRRIKETCSEVIIQLSTGARAGKGWDERANPVRLLPEMASFTTGSNNLPGIVYENSPQFIEYLAGVFKETGVKPEIEVFEAGMISNALFLHKKGFIELPMHFNFVLGASGAMSGTVKNLLFLSESIPFPSTWSVAGIGKAQIPLATTAIVLGGHVRIGLEDSLYLPDGSLATNAKLVEKVVTLAREIGRDISTPAEARAILKINR
jgi:3-keto-5-aminohexanoate cleavage enzyme